VIACARPCPPRPTRNLHGKEGVDGSSPSEGSAKAPHVGAFAFSSTCRIGNVQWVWSRLKSFRVQTGAAEACAGGADLYDAYGTGTQFAPDPAISLERQVIRIRTGDHLHTGGRPFSPAPTIEALRSQRRC
jgi:hypothetical protein